jgi:hypothetical protein
VLFRKFVAFEKWRNRDETRKKAQQGRGLASIFDAVFGAIFAIFYAANLRNSALA